ncbi:hypothetical protein B0T11DRAFT_63446 [Plectosphaerella cucumerina]|jgi:hypothetical protein|uniref:Uncharacterized protein n=1 Tax=Plectosphaerella cucumerina TaxID=40658 RepID=A0A8K0X7W3_9PEZI|nr:hypothetical protein B0T11DRAFT_63446 [Plectosphaerella cucumerina]
MEKTESAVPSICSWTGLGCVKFGGCSGCSSAGSQRTAPSQHRALEAWPPPRAVLKLSLAGGKQCFAIQSRFLDGAPSGSFPVRSLPLTFHSEGMITGGPFFRFFLPRLRSVVQGIVVDSLVRLGPPPGQRTMPFSLADRLPLPCPLLPLANPDASLLAVGLASQPRCRGPCPCWAQGGAPGELLRTRPLTRPAPQPLKSHLPLSLERFDSTRSAWRRPGLEL